MGAKLLLADDSVTIQKVVELTLADEDYSLTMVSGGAAALQKAEEFRPDLILADIVMPELNGYELCEKIRRHPTLKKTPVLLLSSTFETYDQERGVSVGADDHIVKPFESEELIQKIRACLAKHRQAPVSMEAPGFAEERVVQAMDQTEQTEALEQAPEIVDDETFDFELTQDFLEEAEDMFEEPAEAPAGSGALQEEIEEMLPEELPELQEVGTGAAFPSFEIETAEDVSEFSPEIQLEPEAAQEIGPEIIEDLPGFEETETAPAYRSKTFTESPAAPEDLTYPTDIQEIDQALVEEEEEVKIYEIPEEYAENMSVQSAEAERSELPFQVEESPMNMIDEFMTHQETATASEPVIEPEEALTDEEIVRAMEEPPAPAEDELFDELPAVAAQDEDVEQSFEDVFPTQGATTSEWSPELTTYGGAPKTGSPVIVEKPLPERVGSGSAAAVDEETVRRIVTEMVETMAHEIIERVAWEVIPDLAEVLIKTEIERLEKEAEPT